MVQWMRTPMKNAYCSDFQQLFYPITFITDIHNTYSSIMNGETNWANVSTLMKQGDKAHCTVYTWMNGAGITEAYNIRFTVIGIGF